MNHFQSKVALIIGGGSGIGAAAARRFLREGYLVVVAGCNRVRLERFAADLPAERVLAHIADVSQREACDELVRLTVERFGRLDTLVNAVGMNLVGTLDHSPPEESTWFDHQCRLCVVARRWLESCRVLRCQGCGRQSHAQHRLRLWSRPRARQYRLPRADYYRDD
ncbi:short subunit dehydrogenase [Pseudomonas duriflava]|uniref:Short subunit dehydrogenase n=1 Tax=Pseudomonas duriflava TaxID=459528 RepID=A0A562QL52_9PSED|nr:short subunit dehydrogenase [Pseudomonas duriflava]